MMPRCLILTIISASVIFLFYTESTEGIRLCGKQLADFLNYICRERGGFQDPLHKRTAVSFALNRASSKTRNTRFSSQPDQEASEFAESDLSSPSDMNSGIASECCRKPCTLSIMVSYCARNEVLENTSLDSILASLPKSSQDLVQLENQHAEVKAAILTTQEAMHPEEGNSPAESNQPNLGMFQRNRPVFIIVSQTQDASFTDNDPEDYNS
ncbi:insulin-like [Stegodyphus dumicola]|uniref:insulin-like n=1 Tax=Stegodyphus dumicola TaxID=202533 RepID=UPI0015AF00FD|nr:insulin-like [Stegodyphus dumicola]